MWRKSQNIIHLQSLLNQLPDIFTDRKGVTSSHIPAINSFVRINAQEGKIKLLMSLGHDWSVVDLLVPKIKILKKENEHKWAIVKPS